MNPTTLRLALRGAKQVRKALQKRQDEARNQHFDSLEALRKSLQDDPERELVLANSPAHVHAIAEQMRKEDGAAEALNKARAAAAARAVAEGADTSEVETNDVAELASVHKPLTKKQEKQLAAAKKKEEKLRKKNAKAQARVEKLQGHAKALKGMLPRAWPMQPPSPKVSWLICNPRRRTAAKSSAIASTNAPMNCRSVPRS